MTIHRLCSQFTVIDCSLLTIRIGNREWIITWVNGCVGLSLNDWIGKWIDIKYEFSRWYSNCMPINRYYYSLCVCMRLIIIIIEYLNLELCHQLLISRVICSERNRERNVIGGTISGYRLKKIFHYFIIMNNITQCSIAECWVYAMVTLYGNNLE